MSVMANPKQAEDLAEATVLSLLIRNKVRGQALTINPLSALVWALTHRRIGGVPFTVIPPLEAVYADTAREVLVAKASQVFISEWLINTAFWCADTRQGSRGHTLYIFPAKEQLGDFVRARIDPAIEESTYLQSRVRPAKGVFPVGKATDSVGLKRVGQAFLYFRGSNAEAGLLSVDADLVIYDEVDRLREGTIAKGSKRLGSSLLGWQRFASTPRYPEIGIDALWRQSDRRRWHLKCTHCGIWQYLTFPDNLTEDGQTICRSCHEPIDRLGAGEWVAENPGADRHSYHITKLLSPRADLQGLAKLGYAILRREVTDQNQVQEFYNQDLGVPHAPEGGQLSRTEIAACIADYSLGDWIPTGCWMGVDVGARLHVRINAPHPESGKTRAVYIGAVPEFADLDRLMAQYDVNVCVVDAEPEHHSARQFADRFPGRIWLCHYPNTVHWKYEDATVWNADEHTVSAHRTITMDQTFAQIRERRIELPREVLALPEYAEHLMAPVRVVEKDNAGNYVARYVEGGQADHFCHASNYAYMAECRGGTLPFGWLTDDSPAVKRQLELLRRGV